MHREAMLEERFTGDRSDRGDARMGEGFARHEGEEILDGGRGGEGDPMGPLREYLRSSGGRVFGDRTAVSGDDIHDGAALAERIRKYFTGNLGARDKDALADDLVRSEGFEQAFGNKIAGSKVDVEMESLDGG